MKKEKKIFPGADETTPSRAQYFSWINNTNEGATETQTLINLDFFTFLRREYGMILDIYAFDAGAIDGPNKSYGSFETEKFKRQFPHGWKPIYEKAKSIGCRLGLWGGPDGFGHTETSARARIELISGLCRDFELALLKFDGVCGTLRKEKQDYFVQMMEESRKYSPDLILLNHRLDFGKGNPYSTTTLMEGRETYVDVLMHNQITGTHNRVENISRRTPPHLKRLQEDHGVCLSSCLDYWDDDLILQAFNRGLILAPEIYGNPWFLRDEEFPKLARIYNLFRRSRDLLIHAIELNEKKYGPYAVARGTGSTQFLTLRNLTWEPITYTVHLNKEIGLPNTSEKLGVRIFHPEERLLGTYAFNDSVKIEVRPFRSCLIAVSPVESEGVYNEIGVEGCAFDIIKDIPEKPVEILVRGWPGTTTKIKLHAPKRTYSQATLDTQILNLLSLIKGEIEVKFPGKSLNESYHRKIATLKSCELPPDAEALYESTCFAATNNCLEVRALERSGRTKIPEVQAARDAFFNQPIFKVRGVWDKFAFDGDDTTRWFCPSFDKSALRIDLGEPLILDALVLKACEDDFDDCKQVTIEVSKDLTAWQSITGELKSCGEDVPQNLADKIYYQTPDSQEFPFDARNDPRFFGESRLPFPLVDQKYVEFLLPKTAIRYIRFLQNPLYVLDIMGRKDGKWFQDRSKWRGNFMFAHPSKRKITNAWKTTFTLNEIVRGAYLCVALEGEHGKEGAYASMKVAGKLYGAPSRAPSYPGMPWEHTIVSTPKNNTYFFPLSPDMVGRQYEVYVLCLDGASTNFEADVWITAYPPPWEIKTLLLK